MLPVLQRLGDAYGFLFKMDLLCACLNSKHAHNKSKLSITIENHLVVFRISVCKIGWNRCSSFDNMQVLIFNELGLKMPIHAPKMGF